MRRALILFAQIAIIVAAAVWLIERPGRISAEWLGYRIDTHIGVVLLALALLLALLVLLLRFWRGFVGAPGVLLRRRAARRREEGYKALTMGMAAVAAGDAEESRKQARRADALLRAPALTRLLSAQAASLNGDAEAAGRYFKALTGNPETEFLGLTGLLRLALERGAPPAEILGLAARAHELRPDAPFVIRTLFEQRVRAGAWQDAEVTLRAAERRKLFPPARIRAHRASLLVERARAAAGRGRTDEALDHAAKALAVDPDCVPAALLNARMLRDGGRTRRAARLIEDFWAHAPHPELAALHGELWPDDPPLRRVKRVQTLIEHNADALDSRVALAEAALAADLWGEARRELEAIAEAERPERVCRLLARLEEAEHGDLAAARTWLERAGGAPPDRGWTCGACGAAAPDWAAVCGNCGAFDRIAWTVPPRVSVLSGDASATGEAPLSVPAATDPALPAAPPP